MTESSVPERLTQADVDRLLQSRSPQVRARTSAKIASNFAADDLTPAERAIAEDIFRALVKDTEVLVREALSAHLKSTPDLPHDVALALARDVDSVALPMLKCSDVLTDEDLLEIVRGENDLKRTAIAQRRSISTEVSDALLDSGNEQVVARLVGNEGADLSEGAYEKVFDAFGESVAVADSLARRANLPPTISERLVSALSERLHDYLVSEHDLSADVASSLILQARERATMSLVDYGSTDAELDHLVDQLYRNDRLTPSLLLRALCMGDLSFFECAMARMTRLPLKNVRILIHDKGMLGLEPLYMRAHLPRALFPAFRAAIHLVVESDYDGGTNDRQRYVERMLERMLTRFDDPAKRLAKDDIEFLMAKLHQMAA